MLLIDVFTAVKIPLRYAKPFIIGVYHGDGKPIIGDFFSDLMDELLHLSPVNEQADEGQCFVELRLVLGDSPMRAWMTGERRHRNTARFQIL